MRINKKYFNKLAIEKNMSFAGPAPPGCNQKMWDDMINRVPPFNVKTATQELLRLIHGPFTQAKDLFCNSASPAYGDIGASGLNNAWKSVMCMVMFLQFKLFKGLPSGLFGKFSAISNAIAEYMNYVGTPTIGMRLALCNLINALVAPVPETIPLAPPKVQCTVEDYIPAQSFLDQILLALAEADLITEEGLEAGGAISTKVLYACFALIALIWLLGTAAVTALVEALLTAAGLTQAEAAVVAGALVIAVPTACIAEEVEEEEEEEGTDITQYDEHCCVDGALVETGEDGSELGFQQCIDLGGDWTANKCGGIEVVT